MPILANAVRASKENTEIEVLELDGVISISNTYAEDIDISNLEKDGFSTKEGHRGMGLYTVRHLLSSRNGMNLKVYRTCNNMIDRFNSQLVHGKMLPVCNAINKVTQKMITVNRTYGDTNGI